MIKYHEFGQHLRWGNFNYLWNTMNYIAHETGHELRLPDYFAWNYFEQPPIIDNDRSYDELFHFDGFLFTKEKLEKTLEFFKNKKDKVININLGANCQSELWWDKRDDIILPKIKIKQSEIDKVKSKYQFFDKKTIGIGIRLGDFVGSNCFYQIPYSWYINALESHFPDWEDYNVIVFSDDVKKARSIFQNYKFLYPEPNNTHLHSDGFIHYRKDPMEQFILGTLCDNFIMGSSTFSWHQAYQIDRFKGGKIIHSGENLTGECAKIFNNPNYYCENWIKYAI